MQRKIVLEIKVFPSSGRFEIKLDKAGFIKVFLKSQPERGKANKELLTTIAKLLKISSECVELLSGDISQKKRVSIVSHYTVEQVYELLGLYYQAHIGG